MGYLFIILTIALASLIPVSYTWGRVMIGGDVIIPLIPDNLSHLVYQWTGTLNGIYSSNDYYYWLKPFTILHKLGLDIYSSAFVYQFIIFFLSGLGIYSIFNLFNTKNRLWGLIPAVLFIYSPHLLDHMIYFPATVCSVWLFYILFRFIKYKTLRWFDPFLIAGIVPFIGNLPNPKYHFLIFLTYVLVITIAKFQKLLTISHLKRATPYAAAIVGLTAFIWLPFVYFGVNFANDEAIQVGIRLGYIQTGVAIDFGGAFISKMFTLFHTPNLNRDDTNLIYSAPFLLVYYTIAAVVLVGVLIILLRNKKKDTSVWLTMYAMAIIFLFLSKSSNPPFGYFYELALTSAKVFAFMRTTAGIVIYAGIFYSLLFGFFVQQIYSYTRRIEVLISAVVIILMAGFPYISGKYVLSHSSINPYIDTTKHGLQIPKSYIDAAALLAPSKFDTKINIFPNIAQGYHNNTWGYFGFSIYPWLFKQHVVNMADTTTNYRYILHDKTLFQDGSINMFDNRNNARRIFSSREIDLYEVLDDDYTPYITVPKETIIANKIPENYFNLYSPRNIAIYLLDQPEEGLNRLPKNVQSPPTIEFRRINPTKYRIRVHNATGIFPLIFLDTFHTGWKLYSSPNTNFTAANNFSQEYNKIDQGNIPNQTELSDYIKNGWLTNIDSTRAKFVSKKFGTTIQNDNLPAGHMLETWGKESINESDHLKVNGYANSWTINTNDICGKTDSCNKNPAGGYDYELIAEFFPQQVAYMGAAISILAAICYSGYLIRLKLKNKK